MPNKNSIVSKSKSGMIRICKMVPRWTLKIIVRQFALKHGNFFYIFLANKYIAPKEIE